jgi:hypothetical protein
VSCDLDESLNSKHFIDFNIKRKMAKGLIWTSSDDTAVDYNRLKDKRDQMIIELNVGTTAAHHDAEQVPALVCLFWLYAHVAIAIVYCNKRDRLQLH